MRFEILVLAVIGMLGQDASARTFKQKVCHGPDVSFIKEVVENPVHFCKFYLNEPREHSALKALDVKSLVQGCECITGDKIAKVRKHGEGIKPHHAKCNDKTIAAVKAEFAHPKNFCSFYEKRVPHYDGMSPVLGIDTTLEVFDACQCIIENRSAPKPKPKTTAHKHSSTTKKHSTTAKHTTAKHTSSAHHTSSVKHTSAIHTSSVKHTSAISTSASSSLSLYTPPASTSAPETTTFVPLTTFSTFSTMTISSNLTLSSALPTVSVGPVVV